MKETTVNKHYTFQEYIEKFSSIQDSYDYYFELQKEVDRLSENNLAMQEEMARTWEKLDKKENIIKEVRKYIKKLKNFKIKYVMFEEKELYASENDFVKELLEILDKGE